MNPATPTDRDQQSFAEAALRMGGKSDEEARRLGAVDKADEQVETLFAPQYQTVQSPIHRAIWDGKVPLELFGVPARSEPEIERGIHQVCKLVLIEYFSSDRHGMYARHERLIVPVRRVVFARESQNAASELVRRHVTLTRVAMSPSWNPTLGRQPSSAPAREGSATR